MSLRYSNRFTAVLFSFASSRIYRFIQFFKKLRLRVSPKGPNDTSKTICALPWVHYFTSEMGNNFPCCISTDDELPNVNNNGQKYKVYEPGKFEEAWNSDYMKSIRLKMLLGERPKPCERCYKFEDLGITSHRYWANKKWEDRIEERLSSTSKDGSVPMKLYSADIRIGNQCNLRCRMCSPVSSKGLASDWRQMNMLGDVEAEKYLSLDWFEKPEFWAMFLKYSDHLESLHFAGGEPFIIKQHFVFLRSLIEKGISKRLIITYNTNLTMLPPELLELWKQFKGIKLMVSLDGTEDVNHYIRFPSNWKNIQKNIKYIHDNLDTYNIRLLDFNVTVQAYNIFNLPKLVDFLIEQYPKATFPMLSLLFGPSELSIQILPAETKLELTKIWTDYLNERKKYWIGQAKWHEEADNLIKNIEGIVQFMNKDDQSRLLSKFKLRTRVFDQNRKQSCGEVIPELAFLFENPKAQKSY